jgi:hypothetical protein
MRMRLSISAELPVSDRSAAIVLSIIGNLTVNRHFPDSRPVQPPGRQSSLGPGPINRHSPDNCHFSRHCASVRLCGQT